MIKYSQFSITTDLNTKDCRFVEGEDFAITAYSSMNYDKIFSPNSLYLQEPKSSFKYAQKKNIQEFVLSITALGSVMHWLVELHTKNSEYDIIP